MDKFSWKRVGLLWHYMYPAVRNQFLWYPALSVASVLFMALLLSVSMKFIVVATLPVTFVGLLYFLAPVALVRHDYHHTTALLPVTAAEKLTVLFLYFVVGVALLVNVPYYLTVGLIWLFDPDLVSEFMSNSKEYFSGYSFFALTLSAMPFNIALSGIVLLSVVGIEKPTVSRSVLYMVVSYFAYMVMIGVASVAAAVLAVAKAASDGTLGAFDDDDTGFVRYVTEWMMPVVACVCLVVGLVTLIVVYRMIYKKLKTGGF